MSGLHPLCVVLALCAPHEASDAAAATLRELEFGAPGAPTAARWRRTLHQRVAETIGLDALPTEPRREAGSDAYCPRCWTQYAAAAGRCADCDGLCLRPFARAALA
jgi:hypothetical protein